MKKTSKIQKAVNLNQSQNNVATTTKTEAHQDLIDIAKEGAEKYLGGLTLDQITHLTEARTTGSPNSGAQVPDCKHNYHNGQGKVWLPC